MTSQRKFKLFSFMFIFLNFVLLLSLIQTSQATMRDNEKITSWDMMVKAGFKHRFQLVPQIINNTTSNGIELIGNVSYIVDGDTLDINGIRVRLSLVDTPERGQPGFREAKDYVSSLCLGKKGELDVDDGQRRGDRYCREIGVVYCNGVNINAKLMNERLARILIDYCDISEFSQEIWARDSCKIVS
jgi:micrococcal nuclease